MDASFLGTNLAVGACVAGIAYAAREPYSAMVDSLQERLADRLRSMRIVSPRLRQWINLYLAALAGLFFLLLVMLDSPAFAVLAALLLSVGPWYTIRRLAIKRRQKIEDQLADAMVTFSSAVRAGLSLAQALELVSQEAPHPIRQEFQQIVGEYQLGKPLERTLQEAKERLRSENFILFAAALLASRESGGKLNETVERISKSVLELQRLERKVVAETAQATRSAVYMAIMPLILLVIYFFVDPDNTRLLFVTLPGQILLAASLLLNVLAYVWALAILRVDI